MIFNELTYYILFLVPAVVAFHAVAHRPDALRWKCVVLTAFGGAFFVYYGFLHFGGWRGSAAVGLFILEVLTSQFYRRGSRWCIFGVFQATAILIAFKYVPFLRLVWRDVTHSNAGSTDGMHSFLPLGISFFTFEFIHFAVEAYRGNIERRPKGTYPAFIFFFPSMVAGPIKRFGEFEPELEKAHFDPDLFSRGISRILAGLAKKQVFADSFATWSNLLNTDEIWSASRTKIAFWLFSYGMRIYLDFSGYSDIAIGSGYLFGIHIPENFDWPYSSSNITEFWRRWHISLGRWIFDYIYVPLGGSRSGKIRTAVNLLLAFGISGLWHGAAYGFLVWGLWHGAMMVAHRSWRSLSSRPTGHLWNIFSVSLTFICVNLGWAFFCMDVPRACFALGRITGIL